MVEEASSGLKASRRALVEALQHGGFWEELTQACAKPSLKFANDSVKHGDEFWKSVLLLDGLSLFKWHV